VDTLRSHSRLVVVTPSIVEHGVCPSHVKWSQIQDPGADLLPSGAYDAASSGLPSARPAPKCHRPRYSIVQGRWLLDGVAPRLWCGQAISGTRRWAIANSKSRSSRTSARTSSVPVALSLSNCSLFRSIASKLS
jgi:hypothetical protein